MKTLKTFQINKILSIKFIKNRIYEKQEIRLKKIKLELSKVLKILFKFFLFNKKILFLGVSNKFNNFIFNLLQNTKHSYVPDSIWFKGILTNSSIIFKYLVLLQNLNIFIKFLFNLSKINLIVLYDYKFNNNVNELLSLKVPILSFNHLNNFYDYKLNFFFKSLNFSTFYFFLNVLKLRSNLIQNKNDKFK